MLLLGNEEFKMRFDFCDAEKTLQMSHKRNLQFSKSYLIKCEITVIFSRRKFREKIFL